MEWFVYALLAVVVCLGVYLIVLTAWLFPPSLTINEINGFERLDLIDAGRGPEALAVF